MESKKIFEEIKKSMGDFPPFFPEYRNQDKTNCYAHALGLHYQDEKQKYYVPGKLSALFNKSDTFDEGEAEQDLKSLQRYCKTGEKYIFTPFEINSIVQCVKRDCALLGLHAIESDFFKPSSPHSYKILLYTDYTSSTGWHFIRESTTWEGEKIWTHKPGWYQPIQEINLSKGHLSFNIENIAFYRFRRCFEVFFWYDNGKPKKGLC